MMDTLVMSAPTHSAVSTSSQNQETMTRKRKKLNAAENIKFLEPKTISSNNKMEDEHSVFGQIVAVTLRKLTRDMLICCKKIMNDAMFEAEMGTLTKYSKIICDPGVRKHERSFTDLPVQILPSTNPTSIQGQTTVRALPQKNKPVIGHSKTSVVNDDVTKKSKTLSSNHTGSNKDINQKELEITSAWSKSDPNSSFRNDETDTLALEVIKEFTFSDFGQRTSIVSSSEMGRSILPDTHKSGSNSAVQLMKVEPEWNKEEAGADEVILDSMDSSSATFEQETESLDSALVGEDQGQKSSQKTLDVPSVSSSHFQGELIVGLPMSQASLAGETSQDIGKSFEQSMQVSNELGINRARLDTSNDEDSDSYYIYEEEPSTRFLPMEQVSTFFQLFEEMKIELRALNEKVDLQQHLLEDLDIKKAGGNTSVGVLPELTYGDQFQLPVQSTEQLEILNSEVVNNPEKATALAHYLVRGAVSSDAKGLVTYIMKKLLARNVALLYSIHGRKGKKPFNALTLYTIVIAAVKLNFETAESSYISTKIGHCLACSGDWNGMRAARVYKSIKNLPECRDEIRALEQALLHEDQDLEK